MEITCEKCGTKAIVPDEKLPDKPVKIRCKRCGTEFLIKKKKKKKTTTTAITEQLPDGRLKIQCPKCDTAYVVDPSRIPDGKIKVNCKKCGIDFVFEKPKQRKPPPPPPPEINRVFGGLTDVNVGEKLTGEEQGDLSGSNHRESLIPIGVQAKPVKKKKTRQGYYIIDEDGNESGPLDIIMLRNWVRNGQIERETIILTPEGDNTVAGRMPDLASIFESLSKPETEATEKRSFSFDRKDFKSFLLGGVIVGVVFGLVLSIIAALIGTGFMPFTDAGTQIYSWKKAVSIILTNLCFGLVVGLSISIIGAVNNSNPSRKAIGLRELPGVVGASIGGLIAVYALLTNNAGVFGAIGLVLYLYLIARITTFVQEKLGSEKEQFTS